MALGMALYLPSSGSIRGIKGSGSKIEQEWNKKKNEYFLMYLPALP